MGDGSCIGGVCHIAVGEASHRISYLLSTHNSYIFIKD
jgi:hypothetical protein